MYSETLLCALYKTNALLEQLHEKVKWMKTSVRNMGQAVGNFEQAVGKYVEPTQESHQECVLTDQAQQEYEFSDWTNDPGKSQIWKENVWFGLEMGGWMDPPMLGCLDFSNMVMSREMFGTVWDLNLGGLLKYAIKYHMEFKVEYGKGADMSRRAENTVKLELSRAGDKGRYSYEHEEESRKGQGRDLRASDIRLPG